MDLVSTQWNLLLKRYLTRNIHVGVNDDVFLSPMRSSLFQNRSFSLNYKRAAMVALLITQCDDFYPQAKVWVASLSFTNERIYSHFNIGRANEHTCLFSIKTCASLNLCCYCSQH